MSGPADQAPKTALNEEPTLSQRADGHGLASEQSGSGSESPPGFNKSASSQMPHAREPGDLGAASSSVEDELQVREGNRPQSVPENSEKSDEGMVPKKPTKVRVTPIELVEGRASAKGKSGTGSTSPAQDGQDVRKFLGRIGKRAKEHRQERFTNLLSHIKEPLLREAYNRLNRKASPGVDGTTWDEYGKELEQNLTRLRDQVQRGSYRPQPVKRTHIPKSSGGTRPLGVTSLEDKLLQQAVSMLLTPIYEADFVGFSYGYRPGRSQHDALNALAKSIGRKVNWVLDADIRAFFDTLQHGYLQKFIEHRIGDRRLVRLIMKWVRAGVVEDGKFREVEEGTPQGGNISTLLSNIYLHYTVDLWVRQWRKRHARGEVYIVRYADDLVMGFQREQDARTMQESLKERLQKFGLELHPEKTRVLEFGRFAQADRKRRGEKKPETFDFLGLTHIAGQSRQGKFLLHRHTSRKKRRAKLVEVREKCKQRRHWPVPKQYDWLSSLLRGHYQYYGVPTNSGPMRGFARAVQNIWHESLQRRSQRARWTRGQHQTFTERYPLPTPRIHHSWPEPKHTTR